MESQQSMGFSEAGPITKQNSNAQPVRPENKKLTKTLENDEGRCVEVCGLEDEMEEEEKTKRKMKVRTSMKKRKRLMLKISKDP